VSSELALVFKGNPPIVFLAVRCRDEGKVSIADDENSG
jgi:hypothetical protein